MSSSFDDSFLRKLDEDSRSIGSIAVFGAVYVRPRSASFSSFELLPTPKISVLNEESAISNFEEADKKRYPPILSTAPDNGILPTCTKKSRNCFSLAFLCKSFLGCCFFSKAPKDEEAEDSRLHQPHTNVHEMNGNGSLKQAAGNEFVAASSYKKNHSASKMENNCDLTAGIIASAPVQDGEYQVAKIPVGTPNLKTKQAEAKALIPAPLHQDYDKPLLVLDLDETLVHSTFMPTQADLVIPIALSGNLMNVYVGLRPFIAEFLESMGRIYEIAIYTASLPSYADPVIDSIDQHRVIRHRLFRDSCTFHLGSYVKDLSLLGRPLHRTIIIDNMPASYTFHPKNAIPIISWFDNKTDKELQNLIPLLEKLSGHHDLVAALPSLLDSRFQVIE